MGTTGRDSSRWWSLKIIQSSGRHSTQAVAHHLGGRHDWPKRTIGLVELGQPIDTSRHGTDRTCKWVLLFFILLRWMVNLSSESKVVSVSIWRNDWGSSRMLCTTMKWSATTILPLLGNLIRCNQVGRNKIFRTMSTELLRKIYLIVFQFRLLFTSLFPIQRNLFTTQTGEQEQQDDDLISTHKNWNNDMVIGYRGRCEPFIASTNEERRRTGEINNSLLRNAGLCKLACRHNWSKHISWLLENETSIIEVLYGALEKASETVGSSLVGNSRWKNYRQT